MHMAVCYCSECITWAGLLMKCCVTLSTRLSSVLMSQNSCPTNTRRFGDAEKVGELVNRIRILGPNNDALGEEHIVTEGRRRQRCP